MLTRLMFLAAFIISNLVSQVVFAQQLVRYHVSLNRGDSKQTYFIDLLTLVMEQTKAEYGDYKLEPVIFDMSQSRGFALVAQEKKIDIIWRMTSASLEQELAAVYFPLFNGLMGFRVFVINEGDQALFSAEMSLAELQQLRLGQGIDWPDTRILEHADFNVIKSFDGSMLQMLSHDRFDYFPRALHEPWVEIAGRPQFRVEQHLLIAYPAPMFFFVNPGNVTLHQRLTFGLKKIRRNGTFREFFVEHPITRDMFNKINIVQRKIFRIDNPYLSDQANAAMDEVDWHFVKNEVGDIVWQWRDSRQY